jgi:capsid assembly protease
MMTADGLDVICDVLENHLESIDNPEYQAKIERLEKEAMIEFMERNKAFQARLAPDGWSGELVDKKFYDVKSGVGILKLTGSIFPRANLMTRQSGATALENYSQDFTECLNDKDVKAVIQVVDSPGGSVSLGFETASKVFAARQQPKPVVTLVEGTCASLAYLIGSQADTAYITEASMAGSIGVVMAIEDDTRQAENDGIKRHILKTGKNKAIGVGPVTDDQITELEAMMDDYFTRFKSAVSRARSGIDIEAVSDGSLWIGQKAVDMGLVDGITTLDDLISELAQ